MWTWLKKVVGPKDPPAPKSLVWGREPSCFERHLQRRWNNPLFSEERRQVSQTDVELARLHDLNDSKAAMAHIGEVLALLDTPEGKLMIVDQFRLAVERLVAQSERGGAIGGWLGRGVRDTAQRTLDAMQAGAGMAGVSAEGRTLLSQAVAINRVPLPITELCAQAARPDSPIQGAEIFACVVLEAYDSFEELFRILEDDKRVGALLHVSQLVPVALQHGLVVPDFDQKMALLEHYAAQLPQPPPVEAA